MHAEYAIAGLAIAIVSHRCNTMHCRMLPHLTPIPTPANNHFIASSLHPLILFLAYKLLIAILDAFTNKFSTLRESVSLNERDGTTSKLIRLEKMLPITASSSFSDTYDAKGTPIVPIVVASRHAAPPNFP